MTSMPSAVRETVCTAQERKKAGERQSTEAVTQNVLSPQRGTRGPSQRAAPTAGAEERQPYSKGE